MMLRWGSFGEKDKGWTAVDASSDGGWLGLSVQAGTRGGKPRVIACARSSRESGGAEALAEVARKLSAAAYACVLPLPRGDYQILVVPEPPVVAAEIERSLRWSLGSMVDFSLEKANLAWMKIPPSQSQPDQPAQMYAILARRALVQEHAAVAAKAGLPLKAVDVRETAQRNLAALLESEGKALGLVIAGPRGLSSTFTLGGELCLDRFLEQPAGDLQALGAEAKQNFLQRLEHQLARSVDYVRQNCDVEVGRIVVGPAPEIPGLVEYLAGALPVPVEELDLASIVELSAVPELADPANHSPYLIALGSALRGARTAQ
jgi:MSHA biogenesis protein MshI